MSIRFGSALTGLALFGLTACTTTAPVGAPGYQEAGRFLFPEVGFRGVSFADPAGTRHVPNETATRAGDAYLVHLFTETLLGDESLDVVLDQPVYFAGEGVEVLVLPGFFTGLFRRDLLAGSFATRFDKTPRDERERFLMFSFLGYSRKLIRERGWDYSARTNDLNTTYLRVAGTGGSETADEQAFELRVVLGHSAEFFFVVARSDARSSEDLTAMLDEWMGSLDFFPEDPDRS